MLPLDLRYLVHLLIEHLRRSRLLEFGPRVRPDGEDGHELEDFSSDTCTTHARKQGSEEG